MYTRGSQKAARRLNPACNQFSLALWSPLEYNEMQGKISERGIHLALEHIFLNFLQLDVKYSWEHLIYMILMDV